MWEGSQILWIRFGGGCRAGCRRCFKYCICIYVSILPLNVLAYKSWNLYILNRFHKLRTWIIHFHAIWGLCWYNFSTRFCFKSNEFQGISGDSHSTTSAKGHRSACGRGVGPFRCSYGCWDILLTQIRLSPRRDWHKFCPDHPRKFWKKWDEQWISMTSIYIFNPNGYPKSPRISHQKKIAFHMMSKLLLTIQGVNW